MHKSRFCLRCTCMARLSLGTMEVSWAGLRGLTWKFRQIKEDGAFLCYWEWTHKSGCQFMAVDGKTLTLSLSFPVHCSPNHCDRAGHTTSSPLPNPPAASNQGSCLEINHFAPWGLEESHLKPRNTVERRCTLPEAKLQQTYCPSPGGNPRGTEAAMAGPLNTGLRMAGWSKLSGCPLFLTNGFLSQGIELGTAIWGHPPWEAKLCGRVRMIMWPSEGSHSGTESNAISEYEYSFTLLKCSPFLFFKID